MQTTATAIFTERKVNVIVLFFADGKINCNIGQLNENTPVLIKLFKIYSLELKIGWIKHPH